MGVVDQPSGTTAEQGFSALAGSLDYPMFVVTAASEHERAGCLVGFVTQTSIRPPRVLVCLSRSNVTARVAAHAPWLGVHVLRERDLELARWFGEETADEGIDKFLDLDWSAGPGGVPILADLDAFVGRVVIRISDLGDHVGHLLAIDGPAFVDPERAARSQLGYQAVTMLEAGKPAAPADDPAPPPLPGVARDPASLVAILQSLRVGGFTGDFASDEGGTVRCRTCDRVRDAGALALHDLRRLEGASDPDEMLVVAAVECPACGTRGTLVLTYGPTATAEDTDILERLPTEPRSAAPEEG